MKWFRRKKAYGAPELIIAQCAYVNVNVEILFRSILLQGKCSLLVSGAEPIVDGRLGEGSV